MKTVLICARYPSPTTERHAAAAAMRAHRLVANDRCVLLADTDDIAWCVLEVCRRYRVPYMVYGTTKHPRTRVSASHYLRVADCERALLRIADVIVAFDRPDIIAKAKRRRIPAYWNGVAIPVQLRLPIVA